MASQTGRWKKTEQIMPGEEMLFPKRGEQDE